MHIIYTVSVVIAGVTLGIYVLLIISYLLGWIKIREFKIPENYVASTPVSVIVAMRNEEENILRLLAALRLQNYPVQLLEIIIADDFSDDLSVELVNRFIEEFPLFKVRLLRLSSVSPEAQGKKAALSEGIKIANGELIITTDADCEMNPNWLASITAYYSLHHPEMIVSPVKLEGKLFFQKLQQVEFMSLTGATASSIKMNHPLMCNGANLAYRKETYFEAGGFRDNTGIVSGDDTFLMFKIWKKYKNGVHFLKSKDAVVITPAKKTFGEFIQQRIRWASKISHYHLSYVNLTGGLIIAINLISVLLLLLSIINIHFTEVFAIFFFTRFLFDLIFIERVASFFDRKFYSLVFTTFICALMYPLYILIIGFGTIRSSYNWKGRAY